MTTTTVQRVLPALLLAWVAWFIIGALAGCRPDHDCESVVYIERQCPATDKYAAWVLECTKGRPSIRECDALAEKIFCRAVEVDGGTQ